MLPGLRAAAERAELPLGIPQKQGREQSAKDLMVAGLADVLAGIYYELTGEPPDHLGKFYWLVVDVFDAMAIKRNKRVAARTAAARWMARLSLVRLGLIRLIGLRGVWPKGTEARHSNNKDIDAPGIPEADIELAEGTAEAGLEHAGGTPEASTGVGKSRFKFFAQRVMAGEQADGELPFSGYALAYPPPLL
jgi:hypothetical protein